MFRRWHFVRPMILTVLCGAAGLSLPAAALGQTTGVPAEHQAVINARNSVAAAQLDAGRSSAQLNALATTKRQEFNASPDVVAALAANKSAQSAYDAAKARVRLALSARPEYLAAVAARADARHKAHELGKCGATPEARFTAAATTLATETAVDKMEDAAFNADAETSAAKTASASAATNLASLRRKFDEDLKADPDLAAAKASLDAASATFRAAQVQLSAAIRAESAALAAAAPPGQLTGPYIFVGGSVGYVGSVNFTPGAPGANINLRTIQYGNQLVVTNGAATR